MSWVEIPPKWKNVRKTIFIFVILFKSRILIILLQSDIVTSHCDLIVRDFVNVHIQWGTFHPWTTCRIGPILVGNYATWWRHINRGT